MPFMFKFVIFALLFVATVGIAAMAHTVGDKQPAELGSVEWLRSYEQGQSMVKESKRPMLLLFQEIPGCKTCVDFGEAPLSHPLLVEAAETEFVPVAIYNNRPGIDQTIREKFDEPAWNFPVIRFVDETGTDVIERKDRIWETQDVVTRMIEALEASGREVPTYLTLLKNELNTANTETATFAMFCFWEGEAALGALDGVMQTQAAWLDEREVVEVMFDPSVISYETLLSHARKMKCATKVYARNDEQLAVARNIVDKDAARTDESVRPAKSSDQKYHLRRAGLHLLPMTELQATRVNAAIEQRGNIEELLSPRQWSLAAKLSGILRDRSDALAGFETRLKQESLAEYHTRLMTEIERIEH